MDSETKKLDSEILSVIKNDSQCVLDDEGFQALAFKIFNYQFKRNKNYQKFCLLEGKRPGVLKSWKDIPALPAAGFRELALTTFPLKNVIKVFRTSGTTPPPVSSRHMTGPIAERSAETGGGATLQSRGAHFFDSLKLYEAAILPPFRKYLMPATKARHQNTGGSVRDVWRTSASACPAGGDFQPGGEDFLFYFLTHSPKDAPYSSLSHMMGVVNRIFASGHGKYYFKDTKIKYVELVKDLERAKKKVFILSTAFSLKSFLDYLKERKISLRLSKGSRLMETGGFKGRMKEISKSKLYAECEKRLGISKDYCVSEYGMTELSSQFYDTTLLNKTQGIKRKPMKEGPAWVKTLVMDPRGGKEAKKGQVGLLRHFDLANRGSVLAIQTEDLGKQVGNGFELLGRASGAELRGCSLSYEFFLSS